LLLAWSCNARRSGRNTAMWCSAAYDGVLLKANRISGQAGRTKLFEQAQRTFYDEMPGLLFSDVNAFAAVRGNVQGFKLHFFGGQPLGGVSLAQ